MDNKCQHSQCPSYSPCVSVAWLYPCHQTQTIIVVFQLVIFYVVIFGIFGHIPQSLSLS